MMHNRMKSRNLLLTGMILLFLVLGAMVLNQSNSNVEPALPSNIPTIASSSGSDLVRAADVPALPFPDNPDPTQCGIPTTWGSTHNQAWLNGMYGGEMVQPIVFLYDSHLRYNIKAQAPHGTEVQIILFQSNPVLDYYMVKIPGAPAGQNEGWVPAPFLSFEPRVFG